VNHRQVAGEHSGREGVAPEALGSVAVRGAIIGEVIAQLCQVTG
jgi:hypothetical protein